MQLDELRLIILQERETGKLSEIPADLFGTTARRLAALQEQVYSADDPLAPQSRALAEEIQNIQESLRDIFRLRFDKILTLALAQVDGNYADREERKRMLPEERLAFDTTVEALNTCKSTLFEGSATGTATEVWKDHSPAVNEHQVKIPAAPDTITAAEPSITYTMIRILADVEPFMGIDGRSYQLRKGDIAMIPSGNATVLCERNIALNMNIGI